MIKQDLEKTVKSVQKDQSDMQDIIRQTREELNRNLDLVSKMHSDIEVLKKLVENLEAMYKHHVNSETLKVGSTYR